MIVLSPLSETTTSRRSCRRAGADSVRGVREIDLRDAGCSRTGLECLWRSARGRRLYFFFGWDCAGGSAGASGSAGAAGSAAVASACSATAASSDGVSARVSAGVAASFTAAPADSVPESLAVTFVPFFSAIASFVLDRKNPCDFPLRQLQAGRVLECAGRRLKAQVEELLPRLGEALGQLVVRQVAQVSSSQRCHSPGARTSS